MTRPLFAALVALATVAAAPLAPPRPAPSSEPVAGGDAPFADPSRERQAQDLMRTLRCVVCQQASIADSGADMAADMRAAVRARLASGEPPERVRAFMISRYGDWISFRPPLTPATALLWGAPVLILGLGALAARPLFRRRPA